jgi:hypothetical protein
MNRKLVEGGEDLKMVTFPVANRNGMRYSYSRKRLETIPNGKHFQSQPPSGGFSSGFTGVSADEHKNYIWRQPK